MKEIPAEFAEINEVDEFLFREGVQYVDLRNFEDKMAAGYIEGFEMIPFFNYLEYENILVRTDKNWEFAAEDIVNEAKLKNLFDMDKTIFLMCGSGTRAGYVMDALKANGYTNVYNVGGISSYTGTNKVLGDGTYVLDLQPEGTYVPGTHFGFDAVGEPFLGTLHWLPAQCCCHGRFSAQFAALRAVVPSALPSLLDAVTRSCPVGASGGAALDSAFANSPFRICARVLANKQPDRCTFAGTAHPCGDDSGAAHVDAANGDCCPADAGVGLACAAVGVVVDRFGALDERLASCPVAHGTSPALGGARRRAGSPPLGLAFAATLAMEGIPSFAIGHAGASPCAAQR